MKRVLIILVLILPVLSIAQSRPKALLDQGIRKDISDTSNSSQQSNSIVGWGDSMTAGFGLGSSDSTWLNVLKSLSGYNVENYGVSGETSTQVLSRFLSNKALWSRNTVIWVGRNSPDSATDISNIKRMVDSMLSIGNTRYVIYTVLNRTNETNGSAGYVTIQKINKGIFDNFPGHVLDVRRMIIDARNPSLPGDVTAYNDSVPPPSLMQPGDQIHVNGMGQRVVGLGFYNIGFSIFTGAGLMTQESFKQFFKNIHLNTDNNNLFSGSTFRLQNGYISLDTRRTGTTPISIGWKVNPQMRLYGSLDDSVNTSALEFGYNGSYFNINSTTTGSGTRRPLRFGSSLAAFEVGEINVGLPKGAATVSTGTIAGNNISQFGVYGLISGNGNNNSFAVVPTWNKSGTGSVQGVWVSPFKQDPGGSGGKNFFRGGFNSAARGTGTDTAYVVIDSSGTYIAVGGAFYGADKTVNFAANPVKDASAIVQMNSTTQGLLIPRMTTAQMNAISSPAAGLFVINTDSARLMQYSGIAWKGYRFTNESDTTNFTSKNREKQILDSLGAMSLSGTFTPGTLLGSNITSATAGAVIYSRNGNIVDVKGYVNVTASTSGTVTTVSFPLPISSNFTDEADCTGSSGEKTFPGNGSVGEVYADASTDKAIISYYSTSTDSKRVVFSFSYIIK